MMDEDKLSEHILKNIGANIRKERKNTLLTIEKLAARAGLSEKYLQSVEVGRRNISIVNLGKVAYALNISLDRLVKIDTKYLEDENDKINTISEKLKRFNAGQLDLINSMLMNLDRIDSSVINGGKNGY